MRYTGLVCMLVWMGSVSLAHADDAVVADPDTQQQKAANSCDAYGPGYAKVPGTETCVKVSGQWRYEKRFSSTSQ